MNQTFKYIYIVLIIAIIIEIIYLFTRLSIFGKELQKFGIELESIEDNLNKVKEHMKAIEKTKNSWKFFLSIYLILSIFKMAKRDFRKSKDKNKTYIKSLAKVCAKNASTISKIKFV